MHMIIAYYRTAIVNIGAQTLVTDIVHIHFILFIYHSFDSIELSASGSSRKNLE